MSMHLSRHTEQCNATVVAAVLAIPFPFSDRENQPPIPVRSGTGLPNGRAALDPLIMVSLQTFSMSVLTLQMPAGFLHSKMFTASLTSARKGEVYSSGGSAANFCTSAKDRCRFGISTTYKCLKYSAQRDRTSFIFYTIRHYQPYG